MKPDRHAIDEIVDPVGILNSLAAPVALLGYAGPACRHARLPGTGPEGGPHVRVSADGWAILWCNSRFEEVTGYHLADVQHNGIDLITSVGSSITNEELTDENTHALEGVPMVYTRPDGERVWYTPSFRRVATIEGFTHLWTVSSCLLPAMEDIAGETTLGALRVEAHRRANLGLHIVDRVSQLLVTTPPDRVLATIAALLRRDLVAHADFMVMHREHGLISLPGFTTDGPAPGTCEYPTDPVYQLWRENRAATEPIDLPADAAPDSPSGRIRAAFHAKAGAPLPVLVSTAGAWPKSRGILVTVPRTSKPVSDLRTVLNLVVKRVAEALDHFELYHREHLLAESLTRTLLPAQSRVSDLDIWTYYQPFAPQAQVGGDWFDISSDDEGATLVILGDAVGHDVDSVAAMNQIRTVLRSFAPRITSPARLLEEVDRSMSGLRLTRTAALVAARLTPDPDGPTWTLQCTRAGILPGIVLTAEGARRLPGDSHGLLGMPTAERVEERVLLHPGDAVVFFSDGLVERRGADLRETLDSLLDVVGSSQAPDAAGIGEELMDYAADAEDDVSVVVIRVPGGPVVGPGARARRFQLPADPAAVAYARTLTGRALTQWGMTEQEPVLLAVSELVSNAVIHGWGRVGLRIKEIDDGVRIEVEDANPSPPRLRSTTSSNSTGGYGMHVVNQLGDWGWRPTPMGKAVWARITVPDLKRT
ncbi:MAG: SpoIIE family protein phosphatase [Bowdeniella nasicola]|nr:SpoIIE family protein phosphatase [Bowdeniella nasicola]